MRPFLPMARLSWPVQASLVCLAFLLVGIAVMDAYGVDIDTPPQRYIAARNLAYITKDTAELSGFYYKHNRYYGIAFELPLLLLERGLGLEDSRSIYLLRHLVTHAFFLFGGLCCSLLVYRLSHSRAAALFALLVFVLQPRLYAHSFFNSKDLPFLSMFMVTLYVTHRAFRRDTVGAFVLCGVCVGVLTNLRIMGVMLFPMVLALRGLDLGWARRGGGGGGERAHVLMTAAVFAVTGPGTLYALSPYLWANPLEFVMAWQNLAYVPTHPRGLFQGRLVDSHHLPWDYIPTWVAISTPPVALLYGVLGVVGVCIHGVRRPRGALGNTDLRFGLVLLACLTLPVLAIIALSAHLYANWRHVYFLHAPLCGLAGLGLAWVGRRSRRAAAGGAVLAGLGVLATGVDMVRLHPHQQVYFNALVDRTTPEALRNSYSMRAGATSCLEGLAFLRRRYPATKVYVPDINSIRLGWSVLPPADRARLVMAPPQTAEVHIACAKGLRKRVQEESRALPPRHVLYERKVYNSTVLVVTARVTVPERSRRVANRAENTYGGVTAGRLVGSGLFDVYAYPGGRLLGYARRDCTGADVRPPFFLHIFPVDAQELPAHRRRYGFDNLDFRLLGGGQCWATVALPDYAIARVHTGQYTEQGRLWETELVGPLL